MFVCKHYRQIKPRDACNGQLEINVLCKIIGTITESHTGLGVSECRSMLRLSRLVNLCEYS